MKTIAVGTDGSATAAIALDAAIDLASLAGARLVVISSYKPVGKGESSRGRDEAPEDVQWAINATSEVDAILERAAGIAAARGVQVTTVAGEGNPADVLCEQAAAAGADVLVIGNKGVQRRVLANVPGRVAHQSPCTVMIVKTT
jgi:nucleotide-binding universal stress UspA family protein